MTAKLDSILGNMREVEIANINIIHNRLKEHCQKDTDLAKLVELIYSSNIEEETIEYYMAKGIHDFLSANNYVYTNIDRMNEVRCNLIEETLMFIDTFIHTEYTDSINEMYHYGYYGVMIIIEGSDIKFLQNDFENEEQMHTEGYHNDAKYYLENLKKYAINCLYENQNKD